MSKKSEKERSQHIQVYVRCRPQNALEKKANSQIVVEAVPETKEIIVKERLCDKEYSKKFTFDKVFGPENSQLDVYNAVGSPCIEEVLQGYNCTVFAYGQTGTGKTYTMQGMKSSEIYSWADDPQVGIIPRTLHNLFDELKARFQEFTVRVSFLELYNEELFDLLSSINDTFKLRLYDDVARKGSVVIQGLSEVSVHTKEEVFQIMELGNNRRRTASTLMNVDSSRSHTVFTITVHTREYNLEGEELLKIGKLNLVDLAGSECVGRSGAVDRRAREAGNINQSLLTLGRVITALVEKTPHIPYRESKLTRLLQDSLGGRTKTSIIATVSPAQCNLEETLSTLDYAHRAKNITNRPEINQKMSKNMLIKEYEEELQRLRSDLKESREKNGIYVDEENYKIITEKIQSQKECIEELQARITAVMDKRENIEMICADAENTLDLKTMELQDMLVNLDRVLKQLQMVSKHLKIKTAECEEQKHLVKRHETTEKLLQQQSQQVLGTVDESIRDTTSLFKNLMSRNHLEQQNVQQAQEFYSQMQGSRAQFLGSANAFAEQQHQWYHNFRSSFNSRIKSFKKQAQEVGEVYSSLLASHNQEVCAQITNIETKNEDVENLVAELQKQSSEHEEVISKAENDYSTECLAPLLIELKTRMHLNVVEEMLVDFEKKSHEHLSDVNMHYSQSLKSLDELERNVFKFVDEDARAYSKAQSISHKIGSSKADLFQTIENYFDYVNEFMESSVSFRDELDDQVAEINVGISQMNECFGEIEDLKNSVPGIFELSKNSMESSGMLFQDSLKETVAYFKTQVQDQVDKESERNEQIDEHLRKVETGAITHRKTMREKFDAYNQSVEQSIQNIEQTKLHSLRDERNELNEISELAKHGIELHKRVVTNQRTDIEGAVSEQNVISDNIKHLNDGLDTELKDFLCGQEERLDKFLEGEILEYVPTGETPVRKTYSYPTELASTSPHNKILQEYRYAKHLLEAQSLPLPEESGSDTDFWSPVDSLELSFISSTGSNNSDEKENEKCYSRPKAFSSFPDCKSPLKRRNQL